MRGSARRASSSRGPPARPEDYDRIRPLCYPQTDVFLVVFSIGSSSTLDNVSSRWVQEIRQHRPETPIVLVGNKGDLRSAHKKGSETVALALAQKVASNVGAQEYIECSALTLMGVDKVFDRAIRCVTDGPSMKIPPGKKNACLLTTVCVQERGLPDDCEELTLQRRLRDDHVAALPGGRDLIDEYYRTAPLIVAAMQHDPERVEVVGRIWDVVQRGTRLVRAGEHHAATEAYVEMVRGLQSRYDISG